MASGRHGRPRTLIPLCPLLRFLHKTRGSERRDTGPSEVRVSLCLLETGVPEGSNGRRQAGGLAGLELWGRCGVSYPGFTVGC